jgi:hypothetical protein
MTLDHTLTSAAAVMSHIANNSLVLPTCITQGIARGTFPPGQKDNIPENERIPGSMPLTTDGLNSLEKLRASDKPFFIIYGQEDDLMPVDFARQFLEARCGPSPTAEDQERHLAEIPGGHVEPFMNHPEAVLRYERYLIANKLMDPK